MEHLWSTAEANHGTRPRTAASRNPLSYLRSVAGGRDQLRPPLCAREGSTAVRRGSTVRVRQTAFEKARKSGSRVVSTESQAEKGHARLGHCPDFAEALPFCFGAQRSVGAAEVARPRRLLNVRPGAEPEALQDGRAVRHVYAPDPCDCAHPVTAGAIRRSHGLRSRTRRVPGRARDRFRLGLTP
jgi:hypothetical protein